MADLLPIKTTIEDLAKLADYLKTQVGWVPVDRVKKTIEPRLADNRKLSAAQRVGLLERDGLNIKLSQPGFEYANAKEESVKQEVLRRGLAGVELYKSTLDWIHHSNKENPTKTDIGNYWDHSHQDNLEGAEGAALTDAVIFFMRAADGAGLGKFIGAGNNRPVASFRTDAAAIREFVLGATGPSDEEPLDETPDERVDKKDEKKDTKTMGGTGARLPLTPPRVEVHTNPNIHVNIEIHIAADATASTIEEIFKNMSKYVLKRQSADVESD